MIIYKVNEDLNVNSVIELFQRSGIRRPVEDAVRIRRMIEGANLTVTAWNGSGWWELPAR